MRNLNELAEELERTCPALAARVIRNGLELRSDGARLRLGSKQVGEFLPGERARFKEMGESFADLTSGEVFVNEEGLYLYVKLARAQTGKLSPYQCALLAAIQVGSHSKSFPGWSLGPQVELIDRIKFLFGIDVTPMAISRFLTSLRARGILTTSARPTWNSKKAFATIKNDFRLSAVGRTQTYAGTAAEVQDRLSKKLGERCATGVAEVLSREVGAWIEPRDFLVDPSALGIVREMFGAEVPKSYRGAVVQIRPTNRAPLRLLTLGTGSLLPILGAAEALRSRSPIARQAGKEVWSEGASLWK